MCEDELQKLKKLERTERGDCMLMYVYCPLPIEPACTAGETGAERRGGINESVTSEVSTVFKGKTVSTRVVHYMGSVHVYLYLLVLPPSSFSLSTYPPMCCSPSLSFPFVHPLPSLSLYLSATFSIAS